jgi:hypothetical protein
LKTGLAVNERSIAADGGVEGKHVCVTWWWHMSCNACVKLYAILDESVRWL